MIDITQLREKPEHYRQGALNKNFDPTVVDAALELDLKRRDLLQEIEALRAASNQLQRSITGRPTDEQVAQGKELKNKLKELEPGLREVEEAFTTAMYSIPNPASSDTPVGPDESGNVEIKQHGSKPSFDFTPQTHDIVMEKLGGLDTKHAVPVAGSRAYYLRGQVMLLEQALLQFALNHMVKKDFVPHTVPLLVKREAFMNTGYGPWGIDDIFWTQDGEGLIGTAEVPLTALYQDEVLRESDLPIKMIGISPCFRREIGSYGKDTKGIFRVHNFTKVEQVVYTVADEDQTRAMHDTMLQYAEELLQALGLHYRVLLMCTGDIGAGQRRKYDIETWFPGQDNFRETHSDSYFNDFQSRRLNIRYQAKDGTLKHVYTLNNTVAASPRLLAAVIENYQQADGSVIVPDVLKPWMNGVERIQVSS